MTKADAERMEKIKNEPITMNKILYTCLCNSSNISDCAAFCPAFNHNAFRCGFKNGKHELYEYFAERNRT